MSVAVERQLAEKYESIAPLLDERQRRRWLGIEARALGRGGVSAVARATGASRTTVTAAVAELAGGGQDSAAGRVRRAGAGRPRVRESEPRGGGGIGASGRPGHPRRSRLAVAVDVEIDPDVGR